MYSLSLFIVYFKFTGDTGTTTKKLHGHGKEDDDNIRTTMINKTKGILHCIMITD